jgi:hypothetical protein
MTLNRVLIVSLIILCWLFIIAAAMSIIQDLA